MLEHDRLILTKTELTKKITELTKSILEIKSENTLLKENIKTKEIDKLTKKGIDMMIMTSPINLYTNQEIKDYKNKIESTFNKKDVILE